MNIEQRNQEVKMGKENRGKRDGTGPHKDSWQRTNKGKKGKRKERGEPCPKK